MRVACESCSAPISPKARACLKCGAVRTPGVIDGGFEDQQVAKEAAQAEQGPITNEQDGLAVNPPNDELSETAYEVSDLSTKIDEDQQQATQLGDASEDKSTAVNVAAEGHDTEQPVSMMGRSGYTTYYERSRSSPPKMVLIIMVLALAVSAFLVSKSMRLAKDPNPEIVSVYVASKANARDAPNADDSNILLTYEAGTLLTGTWVEGAVDPTERWLKVDENGLTYYVWDGNLAQSGSQSSTEVIGDAPADAISSEEAELFVRNYVSDTSSYSGKSANDIVYSYYASQVSYFGKDVSQSYVADEKLRYERRWPQRSYQIVDDVLQTDCNLRNNVCSVSGVMEYSATSDERGAHGEGFAEFTLGVQKTYGGLKIVSENSRVISN